MDLPLAVSEWTKTFDCSVHELWEAWSSHYALAQWFHPRGSSTLSQDMWLDLRSGGSLRYTLLDGRGGTKDRLICAFNNVVPGEQLVFKWGPESQSSSLSVAVSVAFASDARGTSSLHIRVTDLSAHRDSRVLAHWTETFENLRSLVESAGPPTGPPAEPQIDITAQAQPLDRGETEKRSDNVAPTVHIPAGGISPPPAPPLWNESRHDQQGWLARFRRFWTGR